MGKKGGRRHLKRKPAPAFWPVHRKEAVWTTKPNPGPHQLARSIPLTIVLRDILGLAKTRDEANAIISQGKVMVDGLVQKDGLFPVGLMDVVSILDAEKRYRILPTEKGLALHAVNKEEAGFKLCRIENKTVEKGGNVQLNLHDGRNILIKVKDPNRHEEDIFETLDTLKINLLENEVLGHLKLGEGVPALIVDGKNIGKHGKIVALEQREGQKRKNALITLEDEEGNRFQTTIEYVFAVGDTKPHISMPERS
jgi:small subunit ribosomal protein S4e